MTRAKIGIAVVERDGKYLVGTRGPDGPLPGFSEFPGGKCHPGESPADCARRECFEETGLEVEPLELLHNQQHDYPDVAVDLFFWRCVPRVAREIAADHNGYRWLPAAELPRLKFPAGNQQVIAKLCRGLPTATRN